MDRGAWRATVHRVTKSRTQMKRLSTLTHAIPLQGAWVRSLDGGVKSRITCGVPKKKKRERDTPTSAMTVLRLAIKD